MSRLRLIDLRATVLGMAFAASVGASSPAEATSEGEAADELIAVLGASLPCTRYGVAWLEEHPSRIEYRCVTSTDEAMILGKEASGETVYFCIDMRVARNRYAAAYRFGGTPAAAVLLAQLLSRFVAMEGSRHRSGKHFSPLIVYSINSVPLPPSASMVSSLQVLQQRNELAFPP